MHALFRVRVSGLPFAAPPKDVLRMFEAYRPVSCAPVKSETGKDLGQALVGFESVETALKAVENLSETFFLSAGPPRKVLVTCDFRGPRIVKESYQEAPNPRKLIKQVRDKAVGAKYPIEPVMANTNESHMLRRYKTGGLPRSHDRQR